MNSDSPAQFLCFDLGNRSFAVSISNVLEIIKQAGAVLAKTICYNREQIPLLYPAEEILKCQESDPLQKRALIMEIQGKRVALLVDSIREIIRIDGNQVRSLAAASNDSGISWVDGTIITEERIFHLIAPAKLLHLIPILS
jgi:chemotaxis signal transduction protein